MTEAPVERHEDSATAPSGRWHIVDRIRRVPGSVEGLFASFDAKRRRGAAGANPRNLRGLAISWVVLLGTAATGGGVLAALGPPHHAAPWPRGVQVAAATSGPESWGYAADRQSDAIAGALDAPGADIPTLIVRAQTQIAQNPEGQPSAAATSDILRRIAQALPNASADDRELAGDLATDLYDRARAALQAGKVDEEQRWLALGSILAPPPELTPADEAEQSAGQPAGQTRQDLTPNEAESEQVVDERHAPSGAPRRNAAERELADVAGGQPREKAGPPAPTRTASGLAAPQPAAPASRRKSAGSSEPQPLAPAAAANVAAATPREPAAPALAKAGSSPTVTTAPNPGLEQFEQNREPALPKLRAPDARPPMLAEVQPGPLTESADAGRQEPANIRPGQYEADASPSATRLSVHFLAGSAAAETQAKALSDRLAADFDRTETKGETDVPTGTVIRYGGEGGRAAALELGRMLGSMGYGWHLERLGNERSGWSPCTIEVWMPSGGEAVTDEAQSPQHHRFRRHMHARWRGWGPWWFPPRWFAAAL